MVDYIKTFGLNVYMHEGFDCDDVHLELMNLITDFGPVVGLISTPSGPSASTTLQSLMTCMKK
jgi:hypothetical protein